MGTLYLVATPIGNLEDITLRALRTLEQVVLIAAEDTRRTAKLLSHYKIHTPLTSYFEHNKLAKLDSLLAALEQGDVALVSDAGTPALNDPGYELVHAVLERNFQVTSIPGPSAPLAALVVSGLPTDAFLYLGYLPRKTSERQQLLASVALHPYTLIFLEAPHRLLASLADMLQMLGDRRICVAREITKLHEEIYRGRLSEALSHYHTQPARGEFTLVLSGATISNAHWTAEQLLIEINRQLAAGEPASRIAAQLAVQSGWSRREVYHLILQQPATGSKESDYEPG